MSYKCSHYGEFQATADVTEYRVGFIYERLSSAAAINTTRAPITGKDVPVVIKVRNMEWSNGWPRNRLFLSDRHAYLLWVRTLNFVGKMKKSLR